MKLFPGRRRLMVTLAATIVLAAAMTESLYGPSSQVRPRRPPRIFESVATNYESVPQLAAAADSVVLLKATDSTTSTEIGTVPWTITTMNVVQVEAGTSLGGTILLRQLGPGMGAPIVNTGDTYLAYIEPFKWSPGGQDVPNEYVVIGGLQGLYQEAASYDGATPDPSAQAFEQVDTQAPALPATLSLDQATGSSATTTTSGTTTAESPTTTAESPTTSDTAQGSSTPTASSASRTQ